jgi:hypothetical protein
VRDWDCAGERAGARGGLVRSRRNGGGVLRVGLALSLALALQSGELVLLQADHVQKAVDLAFGFGFEFLVEFSQAWLAVMVRVCCGGGENAGAAAIAWAVVVCGLHFTR